MANMNKIWLLLHSSRSIDRLQQLSEAIEAMWPVIDHKAINHMLHMSCDSYLHM